MPSGFKPAPRADVMRDLNNSDQVSEAYPLGPGISVVKHADKSGNINAFTAVMENHGWYVAELEYSDDGSRLKFMPVTGVETDE